jgi:outer membrane receptor protein involved in Fe transport
LLIDYSGIYSVTKERVNDSTRHLYDWHGNILPIENNRGSEILSRPTGRSGHQTGTTHRLTGSYKLSDRFKLSISDFFAYSRIHGNDPYGIRIDTGEESIDPNTIPSTFFKNIAGLGLETKWLGDDLETSLFFKNYFYQAQSIDITQEKADQVFTRPNKGNDNGYGAAIKYTVNPHLFFRSSYERTIRIPTETEIYGNFLTIIPNYNIAAEKSDNFNLGVNAKCEWNSDQSVSVDVNGFLRNQKDLIRLEISGGGEVAQYINENEAQAVGVEINVKANPLKPLKITTNFTFQEVSLSSSDRLQNDSFVGV